MKIVAYTPLHYGAEYLAYAIRSVIDHVDEYHVLYSAIGSHGHRTDIPCPETRDELYPIAARAAGMKLHWHDGEWAHEGLQRETIHAVAPDADVIFALDADEVWPEGLAFHMANKLWQEPDWNIRQVRFSLIHYWRSFHRAVIDDYAAPVRTIYPKLKTGDVTCGEWRLNHFGYAQSARIVEYKQHTHGHKAEWRRGWFETKFLPNAQNDVHPTSINYWTPVAVNPLDYMPDWMLIHPYFHKRVIE